MSPTELNRADLWATGLSPDSYPTQLLRPQLEALGVVLAADLDRLADGSAVTIGGLVTHRQRPMTAKGVVFVNLEDETGLVNVICPLPVWERFGQVARSVPGLLVRGKLEKADGAINVLASEDRTSPDAGRGHEPALPGLPLTVGDPPRLSLRRLAGAAAAQYGLTVEELPVEGIPQTRQEALEADRLDPLRLLPRRVCRQPRWANLPRWQLPRPPAPGDRGRRRSPARRVGQRPRRWLGPVGRPAR